MKPERNPAYSNKISKVAATFALLILLVSVLFGIYGPKIASRLTVLAGMPLGDVVAAVAEARVTAIDRCQHNMNDAPTNTTDQTEIVSRLLGRSFQVPDLENAGYQLRQVSPASIPGASYRSAELVYQSMPPNNGLWLVLYLAADDGQYLSFDELGRARQFTPSNLLWENIAVNSEDQSLILIWSNGPVLFLACVDNDQEAEKIQIILTSPQE